MEAKISVRNLFKLFGPKPDRAYDLLKQGYGKDRLFEETGITVAVNDVSFDIEKGECFVVMGLSGSGKSTLVRLINRLITPSRGEVLVDGEDITRMSDKDLIGMRRRYMGMVFQHFALLPHQSVIENAAFGLKIRGMPPAERREKAAQALAQVGLEGWADSMTSELSGGMQQRVGLARALAADTEVLLMDEPFSALDPLIRRDMQDELLELQRKVHKTIIFITHDLNEALILGDRIAIMKEGRFDQVGTAREIVSDPATDYVAAFVQDVDRSRVYTAGTLATPSSTLRTGEDDAASAAAKIADEGVTAIHVLDAANRPVGLVRASDLEAVTGNLAAATLTDFPQCTANTPLAEIFGECARGLPIAVLDRDGRLAGVLDPLEVFRELAADEGERMTARDLMSRAPGETGSKAASSKEHVAA